MTEYIVLALSDSDTPGQWEERGKAAASSPQRAIRVLNLPAGVYVATPFRSWNPMTVKTEQVTKVTIG